MADINDYMLLSLDAYDDYGASPLRVPGHQSGWERVDPTRSVADGRLGLSTGWDDFGFNAAVYKKGNEVVIAYRGWDDRALNDVDDIGAAYAGSPFRQMALAQQFFDAVKAANPTATITLTGHSLGGGLASAIAVREDLNAEVFAAIPMVDATHATLNGYTVYTDETQTTIDWEIPPANAVGRIA